MRSERQRHENKEGQDEEKKTKRKNRTRNEKNNRKIMVSRTLRSLRCQKYGSSARFCTFLWCTERRRKKREGGRQMDGKQGAHDGRARRPKPPSLVLIRSTQMA